MIQRYYEVLEIGPNASESEIKRAYRKRAKDLHPDVNKDENAHEQFVLLNEAYDYLIKRKAGRVYNPDSQRYEDVKADSAGSEDLTESEKTHARARAKRYAGVRYDTFVKSRYYQSEMSLNVLIDHLLLLMVVFVFSLPLIGYYKSGMSGFWFGIVGIFFLVYYWAQLLLYKRPQFNLKLLWVSLKTLIHEHWFQLMLGVSINMFLFFRIGLNTLIPLENLLLVLCVSLAVGFVFTVRTVNVFMKRLLRFVVFPGLINLFFLLNYLVTDNEKVETYYFQPGWQQTNRGMQETTCITLKDYAYDEYIGIRVFLDYKRMRDANFIEYRMADGLFGLRVVKDYRFFRRIY